MARCLVTAAALLAAAAGAADAPAVCVAAAAVLDGPIRGMNIGGWLVLESWLYPRWYSQWGVECDVGEGPFIARLRAKGIDPVRVMNSLWDGWLQYSDLAALAAAGITHVRIPVGYWIVGAEHLRPGDPPFLPGGWPYLERALGWARSLGLQAVVELHAAPGSQNGLEHSGAKGPIDWTRGDNIRRTIDVLAALAVKLGAVNAQPATAGVVVGLGLLNEPWTPFVGGPVSMDTYKQFVADATGAVRAAGWGLQVHYSDGWNLQWDGWRDFLPGSNMVMDRHMYRAFAGPGTLPPRPEVLVELTCTADTQLVDSATAPHPLVVGEWSLAPPAWLAAAAGFTYPFTDGARAFHRRWAVSQWQAYNAWAYNPTRRVKGGYFWNFKAETPQDGTPWAAEWSYLTGVIDDYVPRSIPGAVAAGERVC